MSSTRSLRHAFLYGAAVSALTLSGAAWAQDADVDEDVVEVIEETVEEESRQEKIVVTGSLLQRSEFSSVSPIQVITADIAAQEGLFDASDILQGSSIAAGSTQINNQFAGFVVDGGTGVNTVDLRGCGTTRTLVLINGKRPGPAGTRGAVGAFDLNNIPGSMVQRYDILKDSGSTIYGSDAVCGVINIITRTQVDKPEISFTVTQPFQSGGEQYNIDGAFGLNFDSGSISLGAAYRFNGDLSIGDRSYLDCEQDRVSDPVTGELLDRVNGSVTADGPAGDRNCGNIYFNTAIDLTFGGDRLIPSPDGVVLPSGFGVFGPPGSGLIPGYRPRLNGPLNDGSGRDFYEDVLQDPRYLTTDALNELETLSFYGTADFDFDILGGVNSVSEALFTNRKTTAENWRQFFPDIRGQGVFDFFGIADFTYAQSPDYVNPLFSIALPVTLWPSNTSIDADYLHLQQSFSGGFGNDWAWSLGGNYSKSDGDYTRNHIIASLTGDYSAFGTNGDYRFVRDTETGEVIVASDGLAIAEPIAGSGFAPTFDFFTPDFLSATGPGYDVPFSQINQTETGNTVYEQYLINGSIAGDLFEMPAGTVAAAVGFEYRDFEIVDTPGLLTLGEIRSITEVNPNSGLNETFDVRIADVWGSSSSGITAGSDSVSEIFAEIEVPLLKGQQFAEEVTLNVSGRAFDYESFGQDTVYKAGLNWQVNPAVRFRATKGTSFRAPALFEQFLANQSAFTAQRNIDPCNDPNLQRANNVRLNTNCLADGIPEGFVNAGSSATIIGSGNALDLLPETSDSFTLGAVFTPTFADFNVAIDYFEFEINNQIAQLGATNILQACYGGVTDQFANNAFCDLFTRAPATDPSTPFAIGRVQNDFINISSQIQRGVDVEVRYEQELNFGKLIMDVGATWSFESNTALFPAGQVDGLTDTDFNGTIGDPSIVADSLIQLERSDWTYSFISDFVGHTSNARFSDTPNGIEEPYFNTVANTDYDAEATWYHHASIRWSGDTWTFTGGIRNLFDEHPPAVSAEAATVRGNTPLVGTQYDLRGRRGFLAVSKTF